MPYMRVDKCVHKKNADGTPGELVRCHDTVEAAQAHLEALYANVPDARSFVRAIGNDGVIEGYLCLFGDTDTRDGYETYFDPDNLPPMDLEYLPKPLRYEHGADPVIGKEPIGSVIKIWLDEQGIRFRGVLNKTHQYFERILDEIKRNLLATSSGSSDYLAAFDEGGRFAYWPVNELSLTSSPAEYRMPAVQLVRSTDGRLTINQAIPAQVESEHVDGARPCGCDADPVRSDPVSVTNGERTMTTTAKRAITLEMLGLDASATPDQFYAALVDLIGKEAADAYMASMMGNAQPATPEGDGASPPEMMSDGQRSKKPSTEKPLTIADVQAEIKKQQMTEPPPAQPDTVRTGGRISGVRDMRYDHLSATEMAMGYQVAKSITEKRGGKVENILTEPYMRAMAYKTATRIEAGDKVANDFAIRSKFPYTRANEVMGTAQTGFGAEYAEDLPGTELWQQVRYEVPIYQSLLTKGMVEREIPQGYKSETIPLESTDPTWYVASEATDIDTSSGNVTPTFATSKSATGEKQVTVAKLSVAIPFSKEEDEDSIIAMAPEQVRKIQTTAPERVEYVIINGDTDATANTNINLIDGTPNTTTTKPAYTLLNGFLKLALVTNTANSRDGGAFDETDFTSTMKLMAGNLRQNREKLLFIIDTETGLAAANIPAVKTRDVFSPATLENGTLTRIYRVDVLESGFMALANTAGKISATAANNVKGRLLLVRPDRWTMRWKRRLQIETVYNAYSDTYTLVAHMRFGLAYFDTDASAVAYNLTV